MSSASDSTQQSETTFGDESLGGFGYGLGLSIAVLLVFLVITYASYKCKRPHNHPITAVNLRSSPFMDDGPTIELGGLDSATLSSYPQYTYSQLKRHKSDSACSICLADYKDGELLRLLPECGHLFHRSCVDPWLMSNPTCPICRNSPLAQPEPVATQ